MNFGIIGGQDGPAAVLVAGNPFGFLLALLLIAAAAGTAVWFFLRKRKK